MAAPPSLRAGCPRAEAAAAARKRRCAWSLIGVHAPDASSYAGPDAAVDGCNEPRAQLKAMPLPHARGPSGEVHPARLDRAMTGCVRVGLAATTSALGDTAPGAPVSPFSGQHRGAVLVMTGGRHGGCLPAPHRRQAKVPSSSLRSTRSVADRGSARRSGGWSQRHGTKHWDQPSNVGIVGRGGRMPHSDPNLALGLNCPGSTHWRLRLSSSTAATNVTAPDARTSVRQSHACPDPRSRVTASCSRSPGHHARSASSTPIGTRGFKRVAPSRRTMFGLPVDEIK